MENELISKHEEKLVSLSANIGSCGGGNGWVKALQVQIECSIVEFKKDLEIVSKTIELHVGPSSAIESAETIEIIIRKVEATSIDKEQNEPEHFKAETIEWTERTKAKNWFDVRIEESTKASGIVSDNVEVSECAEGTGISAEAGGDEIREDNKAQRNAKEDQIWFDVCIQSVSPMSYLNLVFKSISYKRLRINHQQNLSLPIFYRISKSYYLLIPSATSTFLVS